MRISCASNLRALGQAFVMYTQENKGYFPRPAITTANPADWIYWLPGRNPNEGRISQVIGKSFQNKVFVCPSDDVSTHRVFPGSSTPYRYSYTVNGYICVWNTLSKTLKMSEIIQPSSKILLIDESGETVDDGCWAPSHFDIATDRKNILSNRHDKFNEKKSIGGYSAADKLNGRGNVVYADGHCDFIDRKESFLQRYYNPRWNGQDDPALP
jgi:prepilin-type processing-associated H-X9-DG protein